MSYQAALQAQEQHYKSIWDEKTGNARNTDKQTRRSPSKRFSVANSLAAFKQRNAPQAIVKVAHTGKTTGNGLMNYMLLKDKDKHYDDAPQAHLGEHEKIYCSDGAILTNKKEITDWIQNNKPKSTRKNATSYTHIVLSAKTNPEQGDKVLCAVEETLEQHFGNYGFNYAYSLDTNTLNPHVHVMLYNTNPISTERVRLWKPQLHALRTTLARELTEMGITHQASIESKQKRQIDTILEKHTLTNQLRKTQERVQPDTKLAKQATQAIVMKCADQDFDFSFIRQQLTQPPTKERLTKWMQEYRAREKTTDSYWKTRTKQEQDMLKNNPQTPSEDNSTYLLWNKKVSSLITSKFGVRGRQLYASLLNQANHAIKDNKPKQRDTIANKVQQLLNAQHNDQFMVLNKGNQVRLQQQRSKTQSTPKQQPISIKK